LKAEKPRFWRYSAIISYDLILLCAVWFFATFLILPLNHGAAFTAKDYFYPAYLIGVSFCFYGWFWTHGGQTLGLKTWKCKIVTVDGKPVSWRQALIRFFAAIVSIACLGLGLFWLLIDRNRRTWHDILSKTKLVLVSSQQ